jgi:hypothetical protein
MDMNNVNANPGALLIAPCGMNCGICLGYLREKNRCNGCRNDDYQKPAYCTHCIIKNCSVLGDTKSGFCYACEKFPCQRLKQLDKRYRTRYNMSMLENLEYIRTRGLEAFLDNERHRWICSYCGATLCVHRKFCIECKADITPL